MSIFSDKVRNLRKSYGLSQERFANRLGISRDYLSQLENGREPSRALKTLIETFERSGIGDADSVGNYRQGRPRDSVIEEEQASPMVSFAPGQQPGNPAPQPTRADCERHFRRWLDRAENEPGMIGYTWVMLQKHFSPDPGPEPGPHGKEQR